MGEKQEDTKKLIAKMAAAEFAKHELIQEGEGRWRCGTPGSPFYWFRVITAPGTVIVFGDVGAAVLRFSAEPIEWLQGAVRSPDYLISKAEWKDETFYEGDALAWMEDRIVEGDVHAVLAKGRLADAPWMSREQWMAAWEEEALSGILPKFMGPSSQMYWIIEALRWFVGALNAARAAPPYELDRLDARP